jgi:hypothetical protein
MPALWRPEVSANVIVVHGSVDAVAARLAGCGVFTLRERGVGIHVVARRGAERVQLLVKPLPGRDDRSLLVALPTSPADVSRIGNLIVGLGAFAAGKPIAGRRHGERLVVVLQALDGALAGASQREIACALFGAARVDRDWRHDGDHMRDVVRRAVRRGRDLMNGGYLGLLR